MRIEEFITEALILPEIRATRAADVITELGALLAQGHPGVSEADIIRVLLARERVGSTALGEGLAVPHAKLRSLDHLIACFGRSRRGVEFGAADRKPTRFFFALVAPESSAGDYLKALARISRLFRNPELSGRLMAARGAHDIFRVLTEADAES
jgi:PTS system nitrogen regulatory IIA component